jgi:type II secretory pathway predicted ATPase ExeA
MYTRYFGLDKAPFKITPDPEFFFSGGNRGAVLEALLYAVARGEGIVKVVGEVGSGKTMLCRMLERELPESCEIVYLANPRLSPVEILHAIAIELQLQVAKGASKVEVMRLLQAYLLDKHANNRSVVMFIEEAQGMDLDTLEEIRMLSNLETTQDKLLQIVLFGQPELNDKLQAHEIRQLKERITYAFDLAPLNRREIRDYLNTRIRTSGFRGNDLFSPGAIRALKRRSGGLLRRINILADKALLAAFSSGDRVVTTRHLRLAAKDSEFTAAGYHPAALIAGAAILAVVLVSGAWWMYRPAPATDAVVVNETAPADISKTSMDQHRQPLAAVSDVGRAQKVAPLNPSIEEINAAIAADGDITRRRDRRAGNPFKAPFEPLLAAHFISLDMLEPDTSPALTTAGLVKLLE